MRRAIGVVLFSFFLVWALQALWLSPPASGYGLWLMRRELMVLSGIMALGAMTAIMVLALRPRRLETWVHGMDKAYRLHKYLGIIAILLSLGHWLVKKSKPMIAASVGNAGKPAKAALPDWIAQWTPYAKLVGEWTLYALLLMLVITLARRTVSYRRWYALHRLMPVAYLLLVFHGLVLTPAAYWVGLGGWLLGLTMLIGTVAALMQLLADVRAKYPYVGTVQALQQHGDVLEVQLRMADSWPGHQAGQFAFLHLPGDQEAHPFTLSDADHHDGNVRFHIKQLGDWTRALPRRLDVGTVVALDGPYGRFVPPSSDDGAVHVWIGAGVGATPFLSWLGQPHAQGHAPQAWLQYACHHADDPLARSLAKAAENHPDVALELFTQGRRWSPSEVLRLYQAGKPFQVWFCGPAAMGRQLQRALSQSLPAGAWRLHNEYFEFR